jgi:hypothetical protein
MSDDIPDRIIPAHENLYLSNQLMIHSGQFWRCQHGYTKFTDEVCKDCARAAPDAFAKWRTAMESGQ